MVSRSASPAVPPLRTGDWSTTLSVYLGSVVSAVIGGPPAAGDWRPGPVPMYHSVRKLWNGVERTGKCPATPRGRAQTVAPQARGLTDRRQVDTARKQAIYSPHRR